MFHVYKCMVGNKEIEDSVASIECIGIGDTDSPPPLPLNPLNPSSHPHTTLLLVSPANLSFLAILAIDDVGLLAVFQLLLITLNTYNNGLFKTWTNARPKWSK